jgi:hypothetical protein
MITHRLLKPSHTELCVNVWFVLCGDADDDLRYNIQMGTSPMSREGIEVNDVSY